jgi:hypothetical protein
LPPGTVTIAGRRAAKTSLSGLAASSPRQTAISSSNAATTVGAADELTRQILENRSEVLSNEVSRILSRVEKPGQALALLASSNPWSINIAAPRELQLPRLASPDASVEKKVEEVVVLLHSKRMWPRMAEARRHWEAVVEVVPSALYAPVVDIPQPWMLPAKAVWKPWNVR